MKPCFNKTFANFFSYILLGSAEGSLSPLNTYGRIEKKLNPFPLFVRAAQSEEEETISPIA